MKKSFMMLAGALLLSAASFWAATARAADVDGVITIKNHRFEPATLTIPANKKVRIQVKNEDATPEEFESSDLNREKVVVGGSSIIVFIGPLSPGTYGFFGDFHPKTAQGKIIAK